ncbi:hypothetical protein M6B38_182125 [Iris pallida]|uniref:Uncharacterized protein n=1 Tax=Iris pallida TaxID=29817 RepID=A0AAX6EM26_IRIPA|nr:hypothetical protein M6B38_182125 [Iris pallida]
MRRLRLLGTERRIDGGTTVNAGSRDKKEVVIRKSQLARDVTKGRSQRRLICRGTRGMQELRQHKIVGRRWLMTFGQGRNQWITGGCAMVDKSRYRLRTMKLDRQQKDWGDGALVGNSHDAAMRCDGNWMDNYGVESLLCPWGHRVQNAGT